MKYLRRSDERGSADHGWLQAKHTFSFGSYHDPDHMGFRVLRVMNEDRVAPGKGFDTHPHRNMEIITYVLEGRLAHKDSMGNGSEIKAGEFQRMSAGRGVTHSEFNPSETESLHLYQIWLLPEAQNLPSSYDQKAFPDQTVGEPRLVVSRTGEQGSLVVNQDVRLYSLLLSTDSSLEMSIEIERSLWVQCVRGTSSVMGVALSAGDGLAVSEERLCSIRGNAEAELLVFDLP